MESVVARSGAESLYDIIYSSLINHDLSVSMGPLLPKRQKQAATATVASPTAQELEVITPKPEGDTLVSKEEIPAEMEPLRLNVGDTKLVYHVMQRGAQSDHQLLKQLSAHMCSEPIWALKCHVSPVPKPFSILLPSSTMASRCIPLGLPNLFSLECVILFFHLVPCENYFRLECICTIVLCKYYDHYVV